MKPFLPVLLLLTFLLSNCGQRRYGHLTRWTSPHNSKQINETKKQDHVKNTVPLHELEDLKAVSADLLDLSLMEKFDPTQQVNFLTKADDRVIQHVKSKVLKLPKQIQSAIQFAPMQTEDANETNNFMTLILLLFLALAFAGMIGGVFGLAWWKILLIGLGIVILGGMFG